MRYSFAIPAGIVPPPVYGMAVHWSLDVSPQRRVEADCRWPGVVRALHKLQERGRRSIRIVDVGCGTGALLIQAVRRARAMGFLAIEGRGVDRDASAIATARTAAIVARDHAIGLEFAVADPRSALAEETDFPADIVLYGADDDDRDLVRLAHAAGRTALVARPRRHRAAA